MDDNLVIKTNNLTKKYGDFTAVDSLDLEVKKGEVFGLLGPNGAGKTTTILMTLGLTEPSAGSVSVLGLDPARQPLSVKSKVGYIPDQVGFYEELTARENLIFIAKLNGLPRLEAHKRIEEVLERVGLSEVIDNKVGTFSRGMRQRLGVADVLIKRPQLIIMDEPTQSLDPEAAHEFLRMIRELKNEGITIVLSSHLLYQVQAVCDRVGLFNIGKMVMVGTVQELAQNVLGGAYIISIDLEKQAPQLLEVLQKVLGVKSVNKLSELKYEIDAERDIRADLAIAVVGAGARLLSMNMEARSLDDIYAQYFKDTLEVEHVAAS